MRTRLRGRTDSGSAGSGRWTLVAGILAAHPGQPSEIRSLRYGVHVPTFDEPGRLLDMAIRAEDRGWDGIASRTPAGTSSANPSDSQGPCPFPRIPHGPYEVGTTSTSIDLMDTRRPPAEA